MKTSVVLSAYNGEKFIYEQLESIRTQTISVDEVLIFDDHSTDQTLDICKRFIKQNNLSSWRLIANEKNRGFLSNFINGLYLTKGDVVFLADQDDIWCPNKVERCIELFSGNSDILSLTSSFSRFNERGELTSHVRHPHCRYYGLKNISLEEYFCFDSYLGMATAIHRELIRKFDFLKLSSLFNTHDKMINFAAAVSNGLYHVDEVLVKRRSYDSSTTNRTIKNLIANQDKDKYVWHVNFAIEELLIFNKANICSIQQAEVLRRHLDWQNKRLDYLTCHSLIKYIACIRMLFSPLKRSYIKDLFYLVRKKAIHKGPSQRHPQAACFSQA